MIKVKNGLSKIVDIKYDTLRTQEYLRSKHFNTEERNLLYSLRSRSHVDNPLITDLLGTSSTTLTDFNFH